jgi:hypothetical protein
VAHAVAVSALLAAAVSVELGRARAHDWVDLALAVLDDRDLAAAAPWLGLARTSGATA